MLGTVLTLTAAAGAAYTAARDLMMHPDRIQSVPAPLREPASKLRERLLRLEARARLALEEGKAEQRAAEIELTALYHAKTGRLPGQTDDGGALPGISRDPQLPPPSIER